MKPKFKKGQFVKSTIPQFEKYGSRSGEIMKVNATKDGYFYDVYFDEIPFYAYGIKESELTKVRISIEEVATIAIIIIALTLILQFLK